MQIGQAGRCSWGGSINESKEGMMVKLGRLDSCGW